MFFDPTSATSVFAGSTGDGSGASATIYPTARRRGIESRRLIRIEKK
jgi:hypothetical protein